MVCAALLTGCAGAEERAMEPEMLAHGTRGEPLTTIALRDGWAWPHRLTYIAVALDGEVIHRERLTAALRDQPDRNTQVLDRLGLPEGSHTLQVLAVANYASTRTDGNDGCRVELRAQRSFDVGDAPVAVRVRLKSRGLMERFADRVDLHIDVDGARAERGLHAPTDRRVEAPEFLCSDRAPLPFEDDYIEAVRSSGGDWRPPRTSGPPAERPRTRR
jgi:hypothetical protein